jgi:hypothetical protein
VFQDHFAGQSQAWITTARPMRALGPGIRRKEGKRRRRRAAILS